MKTTKYLKVNPRFMSSREPRHETVPMSREELDRLLAESKRRDTATFRVVRPSTPPKEEDR